MNNLTRKQYNGLFWRTPSFNFSNVELATQWGGGGIWRRRWLSHSGFRLFSFIRGSCNFSCPSERLPGRIRGASIISFGQDSFSYPSCYAEMVVLLGGLAVVRAHVSEDIIPHSFLLFSPSLLPQRNRTEQTRAPTCQYPLSFIL